MPQPISAQELEGFKNTIQNAVALGVGVETAGVVYGLLYGKGYNYTGWAEGVVKDGVVSGTVSGWFALNFLNESAHTKLTNAQIDKLKVDLALYTLDAYIFIANDEGNGLLTRDLTYEETKEAHIKGYGDNGLSIDSWTLYLPMEFIRKEMGEEAVEETWLSMRDTGGDGSDAALANIKLFYYMLNVLMKSENETESQKIKEWIDHVIPYFDPFGTDSGGIGGGAADLAANGSTNGDRFIPIIDPLVLDLNGDDIHFVGNNDSKAYFDLNGNGFATKNGWINGEDGFLALDRNGNGVIDNIDELFGNSTQSGFSALAELDENGDGICQPDELKSLAELGIVSLNLGFQNVTGASPSVLRSPRRRGHQPLLDGVARQPRAPRDLRTGHAVPV